MDPATVYELAYEEGKRAVDEQLAELDSMRQRAVQYLAFVGSATAFLLGAGLQGSERTLPFYVLAGLATALALVSLVLCLSVLRGSQTPWSRNSIDWQLRLSATDLKAWAEGDVLPSNAQFYASLATVYGQMHEENEPHLRRIRGRYSAFLLLGFAQLVIWVTVTWLVA